MLKSIPGQDSRAITTGLPIPSYGYCDQPYVVVLPDGVWLCVMTTAHAEEGDPDQHIVAIRSADQGRSWSRPVPIEAPEAPEASWVMPLLVPSGRVYAFYTFNDQNLREVIADRYNPETHRFERDKSRVRRVDTLGAMAFRYSDDGGQSWSEERYQVPMRVFECDRENPYAGELLFWWGVGKPIQHKDKVILGFSKVHRFDAGYTFMNASEGAFLCSENILTECDPEKIEWETLPDGEIGLRAPKGPIADEHKIVSMNDGSLYCTYRTVDGSPCHAYSRDDGHTWTGPAYMTYSPGGKRVRHPHACNFAWKLKNGKYLYWFHNNGRPTWNWGGVGEYTRNPVWLSGGIERDGYIYWSAPEVLFYDEDPEIGMSYPDIIEDGDRVFVTETQKLTARVHELDRRLLDLLWRDEEVGSVTREGLVLEAEGAACEAGKTLDMPRLPVPRLRGGFSIDLAFTAAEWRPGLVLLDSRGANEAGMLLTLESEGRVRVRLSDSHQEVTWASDAGMLESGSLQHVTVIVDGGPKLIAFVVNGELCDGGGKRHFGWGRISPYLWDVSGGKAAEPWAVNDPESEFLFSWYRDAEVPLRVCPDGGASVERLRVYNRYLLVNEAIKNHCAESE